MKVWAELDFFLHVFFVLILLQQRRHNQRRCKWSCHQWLTRSTKTFDLWLWLKLRCGLLGCFLSLGGYTMYLLNQPWIWVFLTLQVLCELSWSSVLLLPVSRWTLSGFGTRKKETKTRRELESWRSFTLETAKSYRDHQWWGFQLCFSKYRVVCWVWQNEAEHAHDFTYQQ